MLQFSPIGTKVELQSNFIRTTVELQSIYGRTAVELQSNFALVVRKIELSQTRTSTGSPNPYSFSTSPRKPRLFSVCTLRVTVFALHSPKLCQGKSRSFLVSDGQCIDWDGSPHELPAFSVISGKQAGRGP